MMEQLKMFVTSFSNRAQADLEATATLSDYFKLNNNIQLMLLGNTSFRTRLWLLLEEPKSSKLAMVSYLYLKMSKVSTDYDIAQ